MQIEWLIMALFYCFYSCAAAGAATEIICPGNTICGKRFTHAFMIVLIIVYEAYRAYHIAFTHMQLQLVQLFLKGAKFIMFI